MFVLLNFEHVIAGCRVTYKKEMAMVTRMQPWKHMFLIIFWKETNGFEFTDHFNHLDLRSECLNK